MYEEHMYDSAQRKVCEVLNKFVNAFGQYNIKQVYQNMHLLCLERV